MKNWKKKLLSCLLTLVLAVVLVPAVFTGAADAASHTHDGVTFSTQITTSAQLQSLFTNGGSGYLDADITYNGKFEIKTGNVQLDLNGHKISFSSSAGGSAIDVKSGKAFDLYDCIGTGAIQRTGTGYDRAIWLTDANSTFNMHAGTITGFKNSGQDGGAVCVNGGTRMTMTGGTITNCEGKNGGAVKVNGGTFTMNGGSITECKGFEGGAVNVTNGSFTMSGSTIKNCTATNEAGGVFANAENATSVTFQMTNGSLIEGCTSVSHNDAHAGGVTVRWGASFTMTGSTIKNCEAKAYGGGLYTYSASTVTITDSSIEGCEAHDGGGVFNCCNPITMKNVSITNCTAIEGGGGAAIWTATSTMTGGTITGCTATTGGGLNVDWESEVEMTGGTITGCTATDCGGGLYLGEDTPFTLGSAAKITNCTAGTNGGGVFNYGTFTLGSDAKIANNVKGGTIKNGVLTGGTANNLYLPTGKTVALAASPNAPKSGMSVGVTMQTAGTFVNSGATAAIKDYFSSDDTLYKVDAESSKLKLVYAHSHDGINFKGISTPAELTDLFQSGGSGYLLQDITTDGKFVINAANVNLDLYGHNISFSGSNTGNAIEVQSGKVFDLYDCKGTGKIQRTGSGYDRAIYLTGTNSTFNMHAGTITGFKNSGKDGGAVYLGTGTKMTMSGGTITDCEAKNAGGVYLTGTGNFTMTGGSIKNCKVSNQGGGVFVNSGATFTMQGGTIENCTANNDGGGVHSWRGTINLQGGTIENCTATKYGAGVRTYEARLNMSGGTITNCAANFGGGVSAEYNSTFNMTGGSITKCTASSYGGGVNAEGGNFTLGGDAKITGNTLTGGAVNNLYLPTGKTVALAASPNAPKSGMSVGVTMQTAGTFVNSGATAAIKDYFTPDNGAYQVTLDGSALKLGVVPVAYLAWDAGQGKLVGNTLTSDYTLVTSTTTALNAGWYVVNGTVNVDSRMTCSGDVHLILCDGARLNASKGISVISKNGKVNTLTVYGQTESTGTLIADASSTKHAGIGGEDGNSNNTCGTVTINGGYVQGIGGGTKDYYSAGIGGAAGTYAHGGTVIVNGGRVVGNAYEGPGIGGKGSMGTLTINDANMGIKAGSVNAAQLTAMTVSEYLTKKLSVIDIDYGVPIIIADMTNGTVSASAPSARDTQTVTLTVTPASGYQLKEGTLKVGYGDNQFCTVQGSDDTFTFTMPNAASVTVTAEFEKLPAIAYLAWDAGQGKLVPATVDIYELVTPSTTTLSGTDKWYIVKGETAVDSLKVEGSVNLVLCDNARLYTRSRLGLTGGNSLTVYAQSVYSSANMYAIGRLETKSGTGIGGVSASANAGSLTVNGGFVMATGADNCAGIGGFNGGNGGTVTINAGRVSAYGGTNASGIGGGANGSGGSVTVNGGYVEANAGSNSVPGIGGTAGMGSLVIGESMGLKTGGTRKTVEEYLKEPYYAVSVNDIHPFVFDSNMTGGTVTVSPNPAMRHDKIILDYAPGEGYITVDGSLAVTDGSGETVTLWKDNPADPYYFYMPEEPAWPYTVTAKFEPRTVADDLILTVDGEEITFKGIGKYAELVELFEKGGNGYLVNDITLPEEMIELTTANNVKLCLNGKVLDLNGGSILVDNGKNFGLYDNGSNGGNGDVVHSFSAVPANPFEPPFWMLDPNGDESVSGGVITMGSPAVAVSSGSFTMYGGNLVGNMGMTGGAVNVAVDTEFTMKGGSITGNFSTQGGGVFNGGTFTMNDGSIKANTVLDMGMGSEPGGGGVAVVLGDFTMNGGEICGNTVSTMPGPFPAEEVFLAGGGVFVEGGFYFNGGTISGNKVEAEAEYAELSGGGVALIFGEFKMTGGEISNNTVSAEGDYNISYGGGVENDYGTFNLTGGTITGNTVEADGDESFAYGGGVVNYSDMTMSGTVTVIGNTADPDQTQDLVTYYPIDITGELTGSQVSAILMDEDDEWPVTGVLTNGYTAKNPTAGVNDFFTYDGPSDYKMVLRNDELEIVDASGVAAQIGTASYETLADAVAAAKENDEITLLNNVTLGEALTVSKKITIIKNGKTVTGTIKAGEGFVLTETDDSYVFRAPETKIESMSLLLDGDIGVRFHVRFEDEALKDGAYAELSIGSKNPRSEKKLLEDITERDTDGNYIFPFNVNSIQMAEGVSIKLYDKDDNLLDEAEKSVEDYNELVQASESISDDEKALVKALANYGYYAQQSLSVANNWTIGTDYATSARQQNLTATTADFEKFYPIIKGSSEHVTGINFALLLDNKTSLCLYVTTSDGEAPEVTLDGNTYNAKKDNQGRYVVTVENIDALNLGNVHTVTADGYTLYLSALSYGKVAKNASIDTIRALIDYYTEALDYTGRTVLAFATAEDGQYNNGEKVEPVLTVKDYKGADVSEDKYTVVWDRELKDVGTYTGIITAKENSGVYGAIPVSFTIKGSPIDAPKAVTGLAYTGEVLIGVTEGTGYEVTGNTGTDAGSYTATVTLKAGYEWKDGATGEKTVEWSIAKKEIAVPTAVTDLIYDGTQKTGVAEGTGYTVTGNTAANAGSYEATVSLTDTKNTCWAGDLTGDQQIAWSIAKATPSGDASGITGTYYTNDGGLNVSTTKYGGVEGTFTLNQDAPIADGDCLVLFTPTDSTNYNTVTITIRITVTDVLATSAVNIQGA